MAATHTYKVVEVGAQCQLALLHVASDLIPTGSASGKLNHDLFAVRLCILWKGREEGEVAAVSTAGLAEGSIR